MSNTTLRNLAVVHNGASVNAGDGITAAITARRVGLLLLALAVDTGTVVQLGITDPDTSTEELVDLQDGATLTAGNAYAWQWPAVPDYQYRLVNKSTGAATAIRHAFLGLE